MVSALFAAGLCVAFASAWDDGVGAKDAAKDAVKEATPKPDVKEPAKPGPTKESEKQPEKQSEKRPEDSRAPKRDVREPEPPREAGDRRDETTERRIREIEEALWNEIESVEGRLRAIKEHLAALTGKAVARTLPPGASPFPPSTIDEGDEKRYKSLMKLQDELVVRWRAAIQKDAQKQAQGAEVDAARERRPEAGSAERVRSQLRDVLSELLEIRERARERQVRRLRAELEGIERAMTGRRRDDERREMVESRLNELLGSGSGGDKRR